jgi:hypothetical protein
MAGRRLLFSVLFSTRSPRRAAAGPSTCWCGQSWPKAALHEVAAGRSEWSSPLLPVHPGDYCGIVRPATIRDRTGLREVSLGGLEQAELAGTGDRRRAVLNAQFAVQRALVGLHGVQ